MHHDLMIETLRHSRASVARERMRGLRHFFQTMIVDGIAAGDMTDRHGPEALTLFIHGRLQTLIFEWAQFPDYPITERTARMAQLLADAISPIPIVQ